MEKLVLASVEMARDGVRWHFSTYFPNRRVIHSSEILLKPSVECCAYPATVLYDCMLILL